MPRPNVPQLEQLLSLESEALDQLLGAVARGIGGPAHYDALEEEAQGIARRLRSAFRDAGRGRGQ